MENKQVMIVVPEYATWITENKLDKQIAQIYVYNETMFAMTEIQRTVM